MVGKNSKAWWRGLRARFYRQLPPGCPTWHIKRRAGYERRWEVESAGFTKQGFFEIFRRRLLKGVDSGLWIELQAGDGLVGSLGVWLEQMEGRKVEAWEHRKWPAISFQKNRPSTQLHNERLTDWSQPNAPKNPVGVTTRGVREASGVCRAIRQKLIRPVLVGIWNPTRRALWEKRLRREKYRLELVYERMEFYQLRHP
jgi:hypothetical protein